VNVSITIGENISLNYVLIEIRERKEGESAPYLGFGAFEVYRYNGVAGKLLNSLDAKATSWVLIPPEHAEWLIGRLGSGLIYAERCEMDSSMENWMAKNILKKLTGGE
jgi:hypothetical protein